MIKKISQGIEGTKTFFGEVQAELKKCSWPDRGELLDSTVVVIVSVFLLGAFVGLSDLVVMQALKLLLK